MGPPPSVAQTTSWPTPPRSRAPWPEARSSESAALRSHPCTTGTAAPEPKRSDDPPHAPWFVSPTHGASAYLRPHSQRIPSRPHQPESVSAIKLDPDEDVTSGLVIGEGLETTLSARQVGLRPAWALGSAG